jgi:ribosomal protein L16/L10AE
MGKGKGKISKTIARISNGTILLEIFTYDNIKALIALKKAVKKLPFKTEIRSRSSFFND